MKETNLALNPFKKGKKGEIESIKKIEIEKDYRFEVLKKIHNTTNTNWNAEYLKGIHDAASIFVLNPSEIKTFAAYLAIESSGKDEELLKYEITGRFITNLIKNSYKQGHNDFTLNTYDIPLEELLCGITADKNRRLKINIEGNVADYLGYNSQNCDIYVNGNVGTNLGSNSSYSNFYIEGNVGRKMAASAAYSLFNVKGEIEWNPGLHTNFVTFEVYDLKQFNDLVEHYSHININLLNEKNEIVEKHEIQ